MTSKAQGKVEVTTKAYDILPAIYEELNIKLILYRVLHNTCDIIKQMRKCYVQLDTKYDNRRKTWK